MEMAYNRAIETWEYDETPVGAIPILGDEITACAHNSVIAPHSPTAHAEMQVITQARRITDNSKLNPIAVYVTSDLCPMCSGAMIISRVGVGTFGTMDSKMRLLGGYFRLQDVKTINHDPVIKSGILEKDCPLLIRTFSALKRERQL
jgi:tRNA(adenine34) deaminase